MAWPGILVRNSTLVLYTLTAKNLLNNSNILGGIMSWFKHRPSVKHPEKTQPHRTSSPILDEIKKKAQEAGPNSKPKKAKPKKAGK